LLQTWRLVFRCFHKTLGHKCDNIDTDTTYMCKSLQGRIVRTIAVKLVWTDHTRSRRFYKHKTCSL